MRFRKLRIAWSVFWGLGCVLLVVLWADSYWSCRSISTRYHRLRVYIATLRGSVGVNINAKHTVGTGPKVYWRLNVAFPAHDRDFGLVTDKLRVISFLGFRWVFIADDYQADVPFWLLTFLTAAMAALPWIHSAKRFSLRTLLIATTLVAVVLGLAAWLVAK